MSIIINILKHALKLNCYSSLISSIRFFLIKTYYSVNINTILGYKKTGQCEVLRR